MPESQTPTSTTSTSTPPGTAAPTPVVATPQEATNDGPSDASTIASDTAAANATMQEVIDKINDSHNILVALSNDPTVDELSAAIGLSLYLDRTGKRATAIYSGTTPNALEFLNPDENLESTTDALQDFVIALSKDKADHLRYKLDGDYVKIFITPYRTRIAEEDLEFSYGDFNIDLVLSLNIKNGDDLDSALREYGRIMHDATIINISTSDPGKFGEIEWHNKSASSISEMAANLIFDIATEEQPISDEEATAFLTGIIAATDRFSANTTTPNTMQLASRLMSAGADQRLINQNVADLGNQSLSELEPPAKHVAKDPTSLTISHSESISEDSKDTDEPDESGEPDESASPSEPAAAPTAANDLSAALAAAEAQPTLPPVPEVPNASSTPEAASATPATGNSFAEASFAASGAQNATLSGVEPAPAIWSDNDFIAKPEKTIAPSEEFAKEVATGGHSDSLEAALAEISSDTSTPAAPSVDSAPAVAPATAPASTNPAANLAPAVPDKPEINGVPEINYTLPADAEVLPPPPVPPINPDTPLPATPAEEPASTNSATPVSDNTFQLPNLG